MTTKKCECVDRGCKVHAGEFCITTGKTVVLYRIDMVDILGTDFCEPCAEDALESGLFTDKDPVFNEDEEDR